MPFFYSGRTSITVIRELEHVSSKFLITAAEKADSGRYECQASNPFGKSYYHIQLQIWGKSYYHIQLQIWGKSYYHMHLQIWVSPTST
jgi:Immunoglobulin I-set domain